MLVAEKNIGIANESKLCNTSCGKYFEREANAEIHLSWNAELQILCIIRVD